MSRKDALDRVGVGTYGTEGDVLDWTYYDEEVIAVATLTTRLFTTPLGSGGKTLDQTNLTQAGQIPQGQLFDVRAIKIMYTSGAVKATAGVQELYTLLTRTTLSIKLGNKETMGQWTIQELLGANTLIALTPTAAGDNITIIQPKYHGVFPLNQKIVLAALTPFEVTVVHHVAPGATTATDRMKVCLSGILTRVT
jgi:hypothetical protein